MFMRRKKSGRVWLMTLATVLPLLGLAVQGQTTITNGLQAYWSFDGTLFDSIAGFHGTARGTEPIPFVEGKAGLGQAIKLNGNDQFVEITGGSEDDLEFPGGSMSIAGWFKVDAFDTSWQALIAKGEGSNYRVARRGDGNSIAYAGGIGEGADDAPDVNDGEWHHFVAVSDADAVEFGTALYIDGEQYGINFGAPVLTANNARLMIGENPEARGREWEGEIDEMAIWNRVLTPAEIATLYNGGQGTPISSFLPAPSTPIVISALDQTLNRFTFSASDREGAVVDPASATLSINGQPAALTHVTTAGVTEFTHVPATPWTPGSQHTYSLEVRDTQGRALTQEGSFSFPNPWFPRENLPGLSVVDNAWALRWIFDVGTVSDIPTVISNILAADTAAFTGQFVDTTNQVINFPEAGGFFGNGDPYPEEVINHPFWIGDDFILFAVGHINIPETGEYTFGVHSDDGFGFRIRGGEAISVSGNGSLDPVDPEAVVHPANTGDSNTRAVFRLQRGVYRVEWFFWERGGGDHGEFYAARGAFANDADTDQWRLVGDATPSQEFRKLGVDENGWTVISSDPGGDELTDWFTAFADLEATGGNPTNYDRLNIGDPETNPGVLPFPKNTPADDNDFALRATATLVVPVDGTWDIGFNSDDGAYVTITGRTFTEIISNATELSLIDGDTVICDCLTGDSATRARITLPAGTYPIEAGMFERAGGAYLRVWGVEPDAPQPPVLERNGAGTYTTPEGLRLTNAPVGTDPNGNGISVTATRVGNNLTIQWTPAGGTLESTPSLSGTPVWTAVGTDNPATVPIGTDDRFFRVRQ